jgi:D-alanyl-D-alanine dipeptidase
MRCAQPNRCISTRCCGGPRNWPSPPAWSTLCSTSSTSSTGAAAAAAEVALLPGPLRLRAGVVARLERASRRLPPDFEIVVIDAHRTRAFQAELLAYYQAGARSGPLDGYVADPRSDEPVPPHTTGGAADLTLGWRGAVLALGTDFDAFVPQAAPAALEHPAAAWPATCAGCCRRAAGRGHDVLPTEWWHWSYGDQHWAAAAGEPVAHYGECG